MKLGVQMCFFGGIISLKEIVEETGLCTGCCLTVIWTWQNNSQPIGELWSKDSLLVESCIGKKWFGSVPLPFSVVGWRWFRKSMSWGSWRLSTTFTPHSCWATISFFLGKSSSTSMWVTVIMKWGMTTYDQLCSVIESDKKKREFTIGSNEM